MVVLPNDYCYQTEFKSTTEHHCWSSPEGAPVLVSWDWTQQLAVRLLDKRGIKSLVVADGREAVRRAARS